MSRVFRAQTISHKASVVAKPQRKEMGDTVVVSALVEDDPERILAQATATASQIVAQAKEEAVSLVEEAEEKRAKIHEDAAEEGYREGHRRGYDDGLSQLESILKQAKDALGAAQESFDVMLSESEPRLLALAMSAAKRVASEALKTDPAVARDLIKKGVAALRDEREFLIAVDPEIWAIMSDSAGEVRSDFGSKAIELGPDDSASGGVVVKTPHGFVDATVSTQIANIAAALIEARRRSSGDAQ